MFDLRARQTTRRMGLKETHGPSLSLEEGEGGGLRVQEGEAEGGGSPRFRYKLSPEVALLVYPPSLGGGAGGVGSKEQGGAEGVSSTLALTQHAVDAPPPRERNNKKDKKRDRAERERADRVAAAAVREATAAAGGMAGGGVTIGVVLGGTGAVVESTEDTTLTLRIAVR